jgi:iron complex transport system substrate-binding protein
MKNILLFLVVILIFSCQNKSPNYNIEDKELSIDLKYAQGFDIAYHDDFKVITLKDAWKGQKTTYTYVLYKNKIPEGYPNSVKVKTPIQSIACMSLTHIAFLEKLGLEKSIVAISSRDYTNSDKIKALIKDNSISEIGNEQAINYEVLISKSPDIIMTYGIDQTSNNYVNKLEKLGLKVVLNSEYMETHPLGKAEWIKFIATFYDKEEIADSIFDYTEKEYLKLTELTKNLTVKPTVFSGMPWNGNWYVPGGKSFQAQLFKDAGAIYLWLDNTEKSSLIKSKEIVYDEAIHADFWLNQNSYNSIASIIDFDSRLGNFESVKNKRLYNNNLRVNEASGNDYWESATTNPEIVLKDLITIFHPSLIEHELYYYKKLE